MIVTGLDLRGDQLACAVVEQRGGDAVLQHAEVVNIADAAALSYPGRIVLVGEAEACYRQRLDLPPQTVIPNYPRYAAIAAANAERPGGKRQAAAVEVHERHAIVALTNLETLDATRARLRDIIGQPIGTVDPAAAWLAYFQSQRKDVPELIVDDWNDPAQLIHADPGGSWISSEVEVIPRGTPAERSRAIATIIQSSVLSRRAIQRLVVFGRLAQHIDDLIARLGGVIDVIEPMQLESYVVAVGAAVVGGNFFTDTYEEIAQ